MEVIKQFAYHWRVLSVWVIKIAGRSILNPLSLILSLMDKVMGFDSIISIWLFVFCFGTGYVARRMGYDIFHMEFSFRNMSLQFAFFFGGLIPWGLFIFCGANLERLVGVLDGLAYPKSSNNVMKKAQVEQNEPSIQVQP